MPVTHRDAVLTEIVRILHPKPTKLDQWFRPESVDSTGSVQWDIFNSTRALGNFVAHGAEANMVARRPQSWGQGSLTHFFETVACKRFDATQLRQPGTANERRDHLRDVREELTELTTRLENRRYALMAGALQDNQVITIGGVDTTVDYQFAASHLDAAVDSSWAATTTDIIADLETAIGAIQDDSGEIATKALMNRHTQQYFAKNDHIKLYYSRAQLGGSIIASGNLPGPIEGLDVVVVDETYTDSSGTVQKFIPNNVVIVTAEPGPWISYLIGLSYETYDPPRSARGSRSWDVQMPWSTIVSLEENGLPVIKVPNAVYVFQAVT